MNTWGEGVAGEELVVRFLNDNGAKVICRNYRLRDAEIDIIFEDGDYLVFGEVKYRKDSRHGLGFDAVTYGKRKKICKAAVKYMYDRNISETTPVRFDVISVLGASIDWIKNAFEYS